MLDLFGGLEPTHNPNRTPQISLLIGVHLTAHDKKMIAYGIKNSVFQDGQFVTSPRKRISIKPISKITLENYDLEGDVDNVYLVDVYSDGMTTRNVIKVN